MNAIDRIHNLTKNAAVVAGSWPLILILRACQLILDLVILGVTSWLIANFVYHSIFGFGLFLSLLSLICLLYQTLAATLAPILHREYIAISVETALVVLWFCFWISFLIEYVSYLKCDPHGQDQNDGKGNSSINLISNCSSVNSHMRAAIWISFIEVLLFAATLIFVLRAFWSNRRDNTVSTFGVPSSGFAGVTTDAFAIETPSSVLNDPFAAPFSADDYDEAIDTSQYGSFYSHYDSAGRSRGRGTDGGEEPVNDNDIYSYNSPYSNPYGNFVQIAPDK
ncbi:hypothetical protein V1511DRAFT_245363 [Dipodascopsis uninucleata]